MQDRDRSAEPKTDEQVKRRKWLAEAQRQAVELQLCLDQAAEEEDPAVKLQPLGSDIIASSRYEEGHPPRLTLVLPEWPPKLRPHEAGLWPGQHRAQVSGRWGQLVERALEAGGLQHFRPQWEQATVFFSFLTPKGDPGDPDHFAHTFILNALRRGRIIVDDHSSNVATYVDATKVPVETARSIVTIAPMRITVGEILEGFGLFSAAGNPFT